MASETFQGGPRARELHASGMSCNAMAKKLGVSAATISRWAKREGLTFPTQQTASAVFAHKIDRAAVRADIIDRMYTRSQKVLTRLEADKFTYRIVTADGSMTVSDDDPPPGDEKNLAAAIGIYVDKAARLELIDGNAGEAQAKGMLAELGAFLGIAP